MAHPHTSRSNGFTSAAYYDDVFGRGGGGGGGSGASKCGGFAPRPSDYAEIFGGLRRRSSIPVLDLPPVEHEAVDFDVWSTAFDYDDVFRGGFGLVNFGFPFEFLFGRQKDGDGKGFEEDEEEEEIWSLAGSGSLSEESGPSAYSDNNQFIQTEKQNTKDFNGSSHKVGLASGEGKVNMNHVAQHDAVRGVDCHEHFSGDLFLDRCMKQPLSNASHPGSEIQSFGREHKPGRAHGTSRPLKEPMSVSISDIRLQTQPSHMPPPSRPPPLLVERDEFSGNLSSGPITPKSYAHKMAEDDSPATFFDVEVEANSSVTDSAASMDVVIEKAQARLRTAKELMMKKDGSRSYSSSCREIGSESIGEDHSSHPPRNGEHNEKEHSGQEGQGGRKAMPVLSDLSVHAVNVPGKPYHEKQKKKYSAIVDPALTEGAGRWMEALNYYEYTKNDKWKTGTQLPYHAENVVLEAQEYEHRYNNRKKAAPEMQQCSDERIKAASRTSEQPESGINSVNGDYVIEGQRQRPKAAPRQDYHDKLVMMSQGVDDHVDANDPLKGGSNGLMSDRRPRVERGVEKKERRPIKDHQLANDGISYDELSAGKEECEGELWESLQREEENKKANFESQGQIKTFKETGDRERKERKPKEAHKTGENDRMQNACVKGENEVRRKIACANEGNQQVVLEGNMRNTEDGSGRHVLNVRYDKHCNEKALKKGTGVDDMKGMTEVFASVIVLDERSSRGAEGLGCSTEVFKEDSEFDKYKKRGEASEEDECKKRDEDINKLTGNGKEIEEDSKRARDALQLDKISEHKAVMEKPTHGAEVASADNTHVVGQEDEDNGDGEPDSSVITGLHSVPDTIKSLAGDFVLDNKKTKLDELAHKHETPQNNEAEGMANEGLGERTQHVMEERNFEAIKMGKTLIGEGEVECLHEEDAKDELPKYNTGEVSTTVHIDDMVMKLGEVRIGIDQVLDERKEAFDPSFKKNVGKVVGRRMDNVVEDPVIFDQELHSGNSKPVPGLTGLNGEVRVMQAAHAGISETKGNSNRISQPAIIGQHTVKNGSVIIENLSVLAREEQLKREKQLDRERHRKHEEEKEKEKEKERSKDRMAVDMGNSEARGRANSERATLEARQKAMAEARERLERACAEARERSLAEKTAAEAKLKAERAAVERATAETRQRAIEKAIAEKASLQARERVERSVSDKLSSSSRTPEMRQSSTLSSAENNYSGVGESAQRYNARLERHRRTTERMAKALAEKNMRDLVAQREQAERNRLAETLDADIKRWSSGKEGNLRALLSTLQYILGPDWQSIPLTDVVTHDAAKKAYRKATLYVHPDKLQQRGASVRQKYICEKVFDLLQDAWNKYNSEGR